MHQGPISITTTTSQIFTADIVGLLATGQTCSPFAELEYLYTCVLYTSDALSWFQLSCLSAGIAAPRPVVLCPMGHYWMRYT